MGNPAGVWGTLKFAAGCVFRGFLEFRQNNSLRRCKLARRSAVCVHLMASLIAYLSSREIRSRRGSENSAPFGTGARRYGTQIGAAQFIRALQFRQFLSRKIEMARIISEKKTRAAAWSRDESVE